MSDYLWDKSGEPDPEIQRLETLLSPLGWHSKRAPNRARRWAWIPLALAASLAGVFLYMHRTTGPAWQVHTLAGNPATSALARGQMLQTDATSRARLELEDVGEVEIEPNTQVRVMSVRPDNHRLELNRGTIHASIWAPPGRFFVNTPSAVTVDLGCAYTLTVDDQGGGVVSVSAGWVAFESEGRESFIPAGAACVTHPGRGPGIPYYEDAPAALENAVRQYDAGAGDSALGKILSEARPRDAITLWHLLRRVPSAERSRVYQRLSEIIPIPPGVSREGVLAGNPAMLDALWDSLGLGDTAWWRMWKTHSPR